MKHSIIKHFLLISVLLTLPFTANAQMKEMGGESKEMKRGGGMEMMDMDMMGMKGIGLMGHDMMNMMPSIMGMLNMMHDMMGMMNMMHAVEMLDLTPEQKKNIKQERLKHQKEAIPLFGRIQMAGVELQEILLSEPIDMAKVKEKIKSKHDAMAELELSHIQLTQQIKSHLSPEQRQRLQSNMEMKPQMEMMGQPK